MTPVSSVPLMCLYVCYNTIEQDNIVMLIAATDRKTSALPFPEQISLIASARPDMLMLTERDLSPSEYRELAVMCISECKKNDVLFCVDKFIDVAEELDVTTVHVDLDNLRITKKFDSVFTTVRNDREAMNAENNGATAVIFRDVFDLSCRSCRNAKGLATLRFMLGSVDIPVIGAGGIIPDVFMDVLATETAGVCMTYGFMSAKDPNTVVRSYRDTEQKINLLL